MSDTPLFRYLPPWWLPGGHLQTLQPALFGDHRDPGYRRERLELPDGDFVDLDWLSRGAPRLAILLHGLEGSSRSPYMVRMARGLHEVNPGIDVLAFNFRGCSGEPNRTRRFYHSGETEDLRSVLRHVTQRYDLITLIGFSLGGNVVLKYLGENPDRVDPMIFAAAVFSVPCHLATSAAVLAHPFNRIYMRRFLRTLVTKIRRHATDAGGSIELDGIESIRTFKAFDDRYTAPLHGFRDADDYWTKSSSRQFLPQIRVPTLMVNARNDPFLSPECFPESEALLNPCLTLEYPSDGGHIGYPGIASRGRGFKEERVIRFLNTFNPASSAPPPCDSADET